MEIFWLVLAGIASSFIAGLIGLGGGFILIPVLNLVFKFPMKDSIFIALVCVFVLSIAHNLHSRDIFIRYRNLILPRAILAAAGAIAAALIGERISSFSLSVAFSLVLIFFASLHIFENRLFKFDQINFAVRKKLSAFLFLFSGAMAGLFGLGGGPLNVPNFHYLLRIPIYESTRLSFLFIFIASLSALITYFQARTDEVHAIPFDTTFLLVLGTIIGFFLSRKVKLSDKSLKRLFSFLLLLIGVWQLFQTLTA